MACGMKPFVGVTDTDSYIVMWLNGKKLTIMEDMDAKTAWGLLYEMLRPDVVSVSERAELRVRPHVEGDLLPPLKRQALQKPPPDVVADLRDLEGLLDADELAEARRQEVEQAFEATTAVPMRQGRGVPW